MEEEAKAKEYRIYPARMIYCKFFFFRAGTLCGFSCEILSLAASLLCGTVYSSEHVLLVPFAFAFGLASGHSAGPPLKLYVSVTRTLE